MGEGAAELLWVADEPGFRPVRHEVIINDIPWYTLTISYAPRDDEGLMPISWTIAERNWQHGNVLGTYSATVSELQLNPAIPAARFRFQFPPGALVNNEVTQQRSIVRTDGTLRPITNGEMAAGIPYRELMATPPPPEAFVHGGGGKSRILIWLTIVAGVLISWRFWSRWRAPRGV